MCDQICQKGSYTYIEIYCCSYTEMIIIFSVAWQKDYFCWTAWNQSTVLTAAMELTTPSHLKLTISYLQCEA